MSAIAKFFITVIAIIAVIGTGCTQPAAEQHTAPVVPSVSMSVSTLLSPLG